MKLPLFKILPLLTIGVWAQAAIAAVTVAKSAGTPDFQQITSVNDSEVSELLEAAFDLLEFGPESLPSLRNLQVALHRNNITRLYDIPQDRQAVTELLRGIPLDPVSLTLLEEGLGVKLPELDSSLLVGYGYNLKTDSMLPLSPFNLSAKRLSPIGFTIPVVYHLNVVNEMKEIFVLFRTSEEYYNSRFSFKESSSELTTLLHSCRSYWSWFSWKTYCWVSGFETHAGYNSELESSLSGKNTTTEEISSAQEQRLFELKLVADPEIGDLSSHFVERVQNLTPFDPLKCASQSTWKHFFDTYGTHVVSSAFGGGSLNIVLRGSNLYEILKSSVDVHGKDVTIMNYFHASSSSQLRVDENSTFFVTNVYKTVSFKAGDPKFQKPDLFNIEDQDEKNRVVEEWKNSISQNPVMLDSNLELASIMNYIQVVNLTLRDTLNYQAAVNYWLSGSLRSCEWYGARPRPVTIWYDENTETGFPWNYPVRKMVNGDILGAPIYISALNATDHILCSEDEKCEVKYVQAHCAPAECPKKSFHIHYESEYVNKA